MSFDESYQLLELTGDEGVKTFIARRISSGTKVTVFLFVSAQAQAYAELLRQLRTADRAQWPDLIEVGDNRGTIYVVMEPLLSFAELKERAARLKTAPPAHSEHKPEEFTRAGIWRIPPSLQSTPSRADVPSAPGSFTQMFQTAAPPIGEPVPEIPVVPPAPPAAPAPEPSAPGSFTQMFQTAAPPIGEPVPEVPVVPPAPQPRVVPPASVKSAPGEFTRMFQAAAPPMNETTIETAPPKQSSPGSFTQMFQAAAPPMGEQETKAPPKATEPSGPGEFTRFFNASAAVPKPAVPKPTTAPSSTPILPKQEAQGDFESIFGSADRPASPPSSITGIFQSSSVSPAVKPEQAGSGESLTPPPAFTPRPGEFTRVFGGPAPEVSMPSPVAAPLPPSAPSPAAAPGEYTRMFSAQPLPPEPNPAPAAPEIKAPEPEPQPKRTSMLIPVLIGVIVLLLAAIAVILVVIKK